MRVLDIAELASGIQAADVVISTVAMGARVITCILLGGHVVLSHKFSMDLSVPRSIEAAPWKTCRTYCYISALPPARTGHTPRARRVSASGIPPALCSG